MQKKTKAKKLTIADVAMFEPQIKLNPSPADVSDAIQTTPALLTPAPSPLPIHADSPASAALPAPILSSHAPAV